jgi:Cu+-exporting ATPase
MAEPIACDCGPAESFDFAAWWRVGVGILIAGNSMTVSLAVNTSEIASDEAAVVHAVLGGLAVLSLALLGLPLIRNTWDSIRARRISLEGLFVSGVIGAFTASAVATLTGRGDVYFEIVSILLVVYAFGQQVTSGAQERALSATRSWAPEFTTCTRLDDDGGADTVGLAEIRPGDRVRVDPGESIPVDGTIEDGTAWIREAEMTGEGLAVVRRPGDPVWAGTHSLDAGIVVRASSAAGERRIDAIVDAVEHARTQPTSWQHRADRLVAVFLPVVLAISATTFAVWTVLDHWTTGLFNAMAVLLVACPCALGLATPLAAWAALGRLAGRGLIAESGAVIEALDAVDTVVFDKTGTLTATTLSLLDLVTEGGTAERRQVRTAVQLLEEASGHPIATAFRDLVRHPDGQVSDTRVLPGVGFSGHVRLAGSKPERWAVGVPEGFGVADDAGWHRLARALNAPAGARRLAVLRAGRPVAAAAIDEHRRGGMTATFAKLDELGMTTEVFTGDRAERARNINVHRVLASLEPNDKLREVRTRQEAGRRVLFVGDGVNDAAAMATADVGIAVAEGADLALEVADISWHGGDLGTIPWAISLARRTVRTIRSNLAIALAYNAVGISLAVAGILHPVAATILMTCSSLIVTWRATGVLSDDQREVEAAMSIPTTDRLVGDTR